MTYEIGCFHTDFPEMRWISTIPKWWFGSPLIDTGPVKTIRADYLKMVKRHIDRTELRPWVSFGILCQCSLKTTKFLCCTIPIPNGTSKPRILSPRLKTISAIQKRRGKVAGREVWRENQGVVGKTMPCLPPIFLGMFYITYKMVIWGMVYDIVLSTLMLWKQW